MVGTMHVHDSVREARNASADHPIIGQVGEGEQLLAISEGTQKSYYFAASPSKLIHTRAPYDLAELPRGCYMNEEDDTQQTDDEHQWRDPYALDTVGRQCAFATIGHGALACGLRRHPT